MGAEPSEVLEILESGTNPLVAESPEAFDRLSELVFVNPPPMPAQSRSSAHWNGTPWA